MAKISVITVSFNSAKTIEQTIMSVVSQKGVDWEYIIIDGGSTDETLAIANRYRDYLAKIISGPDKGLYDAMNKGIMLATGDIIAILNADDFFKDSTVLSKISDTFEKEGVEAVYGDVEYFNRNDPNERMRYWKAGRYSSKKLSAGWIMPHPSFFAKRDVYNKFGYFNLDFNIAADYELLLRFLKNNIKTAYIPKALVCMREGGHSAKSLSQRIRGWKELKAAWRLNFGSLPLLFITRRVLSKIKQYII